MCAECTVQPHRYGNSSNNIKSNQFENMTGNPLKADTTTTCTGPNVKHVHRSKPGTVMGVWHQGDFSVERLVRAALLCAHMYCIVQGSSTYTRSCFTCIVYGGTTYNKKDPQTFEASKVEKTSVVFDRTESTTCEKWREEDWQLEKIQSRLFQRDRKKLACTRSGIGGSWRVERNQAYLRII